MALTPNHLRAMAVLRVAALGSAVFFLSACFNDTRFKADSEVNFERSFAQVTNQMSVLDKAKLDVALRDIVLVQTGVFGPLLEAKSYQVPSNEPGAEVGRGFSNAFANAMTNAIEVGVRTKWDENRAKLVVEKAGAIIDGRTAKEIITLAVDERKKSIEAAIAIYRDQLAKAKAALRDILADSEAALQKQAAQMSILQQIKITHASFRYSTSTSLKEPVISFTIANGGPVPLKRIFVAGKLQTPGRAIPWVDREFNYELPGGLEPKETQALSLSPNMFSEWGRVSEEAIDGAVLTLDLIAFEDAGGKRIGKGDANSATLNREKALEAGIGELESRIVGLDKQGSFSAPDPALVMSPPPTKEQHIESGSATEISPNTDHALAAFERAKAAGTVQAWDAFLQLFDTGPLVQQAQEERKKLVAVSAPERLNSEGPATKAATIPSPTAPPDTEQSKWNITESKSPVDDSPEISAMLFSERGKAALALRCKEKKTEAVIVPDAFIGSSETLRVLYRINDGKATEARWHPSTSGKGAFVPNAVSFIKLLPDDGDLFVRVHDFQGSGHDASFRLGAVSDVRSKIATLCRWPTVPKSPTASVSATATRPSPKKPLKPTVETLSAPTPLR